MNKGFITTGLIITTLLIGVVAGAVTSLNLNNKLTLLKADIENVEFGAVNFTPVQAQKFKLSGSGVAGGDTSITLRTMKTPDGREITMSMLGDTGYMTLEPGTAREEQITFTGITQSGSDDTATLTGVERGLDFVFPYSASTTLQKSHAGGSIAILTNNAKFYGQEFAFTNSDATITQKWVFPSSTDLWPRAAATTSLTTATATLFATKDYVDGVATSGAADASDSVKGLVEIATTSDVLAGTSAGDGDTSAFIVPDTSIFNGTSSARVLVPVTQADGKLDQDYLQLGELWPFTDAITVTGSSTLSGITTLAGNTSSTGRFDVMGTSTFYTTTTFVSATDGIFDFGSSTLSTSTVANGSTLFVEMVSVTSTFDSVGRGLVTFVGYGSPGSANEGGSIRLLIDNATPSQIGTSTPMVKIDKTTGADDGNLSFTYITDELSAGTHTFTVESAGIGGGTFTVEIIQFAVLFFQ